MTPREQEEYRALRLTIAARGTSRVWVVVTGLAVWAPLVTAVTALALPPLAALISLLLLVATFEAVFTLHVGVERMGRYLQVFHEDHWERAAMDFGVPLAGTSSDPLFVALFASAGILNLVPVAAADPVQIELVVVGIAHALFIVRLIVARRVASRQRASDLERFRALRKGA